MHEVKGAWGISLTASVVSRSRRKAGQAAEEATLLILAHTGNGGVFMNVHVRESEWSLGLCVVYPCLLLYNYNTVVTAELAHTE